MHSRLALKLLRLFALGVLAATEVQCLALEAYADGLHSDELLRRLAKAGSSGKHSGNVVRDIVRAAEGMGIGKDQAKAYIFDAPGPAGRQVKVTAFYRTRCTVHWLTGTRHCRSPWARTERVDRRGFPR